MKKLFSILAFIAISSGAVFFSGCTKTDTTKPVLTLTGLASVDVILNSSNYSDPGCQANDDVDGDLTASIVTSGTVNTNLAGTYVITYTVSDKAGNTNSITRSVRVYNEAEIYKGTWSVSDVAGGVTTPYTETITPSDIKNNRVSFKQFGAYNPCAPYADITGLSITVPSQTIINAGSPPADRTFSGTGTIGANHTSMTINYSETTNGNTTTGVGTYTFVSH
ncbi:MAG: DUF5011 domain-containing protein [Bacteroidota bacterium]